MKSILVLYGTAIFIAILAAIIRLHPYDDTDNEIESLRSGMYLYTDHGTGCQYLSAGFARVLVPRLTATGSHKCN